MENIEDVHKQIDTAMKEERWSDAIALCKGVPHEINDPAITLKSGLAYYRLGEYRQATAALLPMCVGMHEDLVENPSHTDLILTYVTCRATLIQCLYKSMGVDGRFATLQAMELEERVAGWRKSLALENTPIPAFDAMMITVGLVTPPEQA